MTTSPRIPYALVPARIVKLRPKDVGKYCRDHHMTWDEFWRQSVILAGQQHCPDCGHKQEAHTPYRRRQYWQSMPALRQICTRRFK